MTTILSFVVVIGILILIHELGHFFVARWTGVGVERFSIGFGPVLLRWRGKETEYCLSLIPMGGYVKMVGEESPLEGGGGPVVDADKSFALKPLWARFAIVFAGPGMNLVLAWVIFVCVLAMVGRPVWPATLGRVTESGPAAAAGLATGDVVTAVNGTPVAYWEDLERALTDSNGRPLDLRVRRGSDAERAVTVTPRLRAVPDPIFHEPREVWDIGAGPQLVPQISSVSAGSPAARGGLQPGDVVLAVADQPVYTPEDLVEAIRTRPGKALPMTVERGGQRLTLTVTPDLVSEKGPDGKPREVGRIQAGIATKAVRFEPYPAIASIGYGAVKTWDITVLTVKGLGKLVQGHIPLSNLGGPIQIATEGERQRREGLPSLAVFTAIISVNLAVLNLLPIPVLDGGHLFFFVIEGLRGRPVSLRTREMAARVGLVLLLVLMVFASYNDLARLDVFKFFR